MTDIEKDAHNVELPAEALDGTRSARQETGHRRTDAELLRDELESVSGGFDRDWLKDGCAATVEPGSWCGSNDSCYMVDVVYAHRPVGICPYCGGYRYSRPSLEEYVCSKCGKTKDWGNND